MCVGGGIYLLFEYVNTKFIVLMYICSDSYFTWILFEKYLDTFLLSEEREREKELGLPH